MVFPPNNWAEQTMLIQRFPSKEVLINEHYHSYLGSLFLEGYEQVPLIDIASTIIMVSKLNCYPSHHAEGMITVFMLIEPVHHVAENKEGEVTGYTSMMLPRLGSFVDVFEIKLIQISRMEPSHQYLSSSVMRRINLNLHHTVFGRQRYSFSYDREICIWKSLVRCREKLEKECSSLLLSVNPQHKRDLRSLSQQAAREFGSVCLGVFPDSTTCQLIVKRPSIKSVNQVYEKLAHDNSLDLRDFAIVESQPSSPPVLSIIDDHLRGVAYGGETKTHLDPENSLLAAFSTMCSRFPDSILSHYDFQLGHPQYSDRQSRMDIKELNTPPPADIEFTPSSL